MTEINLLPSEYRKKPLTLRNILLILFVILLAGLIMKYACIEPLHKEQDGKQQLGALRQETLELPELEELCIQQKDLFEELNQRFLAFQALEENTPLYWQGILSTIMESLPEGSVLTQFTCDNSILLISGTCPNDKISAAYLRKLTESGHFPEARMEKIVYQQNDEVTYTIRCSLEKGMEGKY
ncbi:MAG TPA: hypothetical protein DIW17_16950 [Clostridiales bacterium]|mgnify:FL=1|nr:hypothetical protein [Clostridiales bacterium]